MTKLQHFITGIAGISFEQENARKVKLGDALVACRDYDNEFDACAIYVETKDGKRLGFIPASVANTLVREYGNNISLHGTVVEVLNGNENIGLRVKLVVSQPSVSKGGKDVFAPGGRRLGAFIEKKNNKVYIQTEFGVLVLPEGVVTVGES